MFINISCLAGSVAIFYLDGEPIPHCIQADDESGEIWIARFDIPIELANPGDYIMNDKIVEKRTGRVEIRFDLTKTTLTEEELKQDIKENCLPFEVTKVGIS